jgi:hypothetical protein
MDIAMERLPPGVKIICAKDVMKHQHTQLKALGTPIVLVEADHSCQAARAASIDNMMGLERRCYLAEGAKVCLAMDVGAHVGLWAHAPGVVKMLVYGDDTDPPQVLKYVLVDFGESYRGESVFPGKPRMAGLGSGVPVHGPVGQESNAQPDHDSAEAGVSVVRLECSGDKPNADGCVALVNRLLSPRPWEYDRN